jgi:hypothetical protein
MMATIRRHVPKRRSMPMAKVARAKISDAYDKTGQAMTDTMKYGMQHPGQASLVAFGVGLGMGMWFTASRKPRTGLGPALADALGAVSRQLFSR